jgi:hypothetical protein
VRYKSGQVQVGHPISSLKGRLARVAGGTDDGSSWKASLSNDEPLDSPKFEEAIGVLRGAYIVAIDSRIAELRKVC